MGRKLEKRPYYLHGWAGNKDAWEYNYKKFRFYGKAGPQNQGEPLLYAQKLTSERNAAW